MKISSEQAQDIVFEEWSDKGLKIISVGDWVSDGKYETCESIFEYKGKFYSLVVSRTGSPYTDWHYTWEDTDTFDCPEVKKVEVITTKWVKI